jgi:hypothetical protein
MGGKRSVNGNAHRIFIGKYEGGKKRSFGRERRRILKWILKKVLTNSSILECGLSADSCGH